MATQFTGQIYAISPDLAEPLIIENFNLSQDIISLAGATAAYTTETVDGNLQISTPEGKLLATITGVPALSSYKGSSPEGTSYLLSLENEFFSTYVEPYFFNPVYPVQNPDVDELIASGEYESYYDHFLKAGQFELREDTFLAGTEQDDTLYSVGYETVLVGVPITQAQYQGGIDVVATDMGTGRVDTFYGGAGKEAIFVLGTSNIFNETAQSFYVGGGDEDYALIKDFTSGDRIFLGSDAAGFTQEVVDGNTQISKDGDLIAIVEGVTELAVREDDNKELIATDEATAAYARGTDGDDVIYPNDRQSNVLGVPVTTTKDGTVVATSTGVGEFDILYDSEGSFSFYLGFVTADSPDTPQTFYVGNGDEDYALIKSYDPILDRAIYAPGRFDDYKIEVVDGDTRISKDGDLIAVVEDVILIPEFGADYVGLLSSEDEVYNQTLKPYFNETLYLENNPDVRTAVEAGEYESGYQQFLRAGILEGRYGFYNGLDDGSTNSDVYGVGNSYVIGLPVTEFDAESEQFTTESTGTGRVDILSASALTNKFVIGSNGQSFYVGNGDEDYTTIGGFGTFDPLKDFIYAAGDFSDYTVETVEVPIEDSEETQTNTNISYQGDLVAVLERVDVTLEEFSLGQDNAFAFVAPENEAIESTSSLFTGEIYEISADLTEPLVIENFDITKDVLSLAGITDDYNIETVDGNVQISTTEGALLATITGVEELKPYTGANPDGGTYLLSLENEFYSQNIEPAFFAPYYPIQNPDVDALIEAGEYTSYYDHFLRAGQFEEREDTFFQGTVGNDTLYSIGWENILVGVPITAADYINGLDVVPVNTGEGQIDTLIGNGGKQKETIFVLGNGTVLNETPQTFYLGGGDSDYALIKNFLAGDRIFLGSDVAEFTQTEVDGNLHISKDGDLIAIVEDRTVLTSDRDNELTSFDTESYASGTAGDDIVTAATRQTQVIGVPLALNDAGEVYGTTTGEGEFDTLNGSTRGDSFYLGIANTPDGEAQPLYVGNGDADYALIPTFSNTEQYDSVVLAGKVSDYQFEFEAYAGTGNDTKIYTKEGDLIGIVENTTLSQFYVEGIGITLYSVSTSGTTAEVADYLFDIEPFFYEEFYLDENPEVADLIASGEYGSAFEHFIEVGQFSPESEVILAGTAGDDIIPSMGNADLLFGVPLIEVDGELEGWETASTGVGEKDTLAGGLGVTTFVIGNDRILNPAEPNEVYYVGEGDEDYALIQGFQPTQDFIFGAGSIDEYNFATVEGDLEISYGDDLVAIVEDAGDLTLQAFPLGEERSRALALVAPENQFLPTEPPTPVFGSIGDDAIDVTSSNELIFAGSDNDTIDATSSQGNNRIYLGTGDDTVILGSKDILTGQDGDDRFFAQTGGDNILTGGMGADQFWIASAEIPESANTVTDFTLGEDVLGIAGLGASFESLTLTQQDTDALVAFNGSNLAVLKGILVNDLNGDSFAFA